MKKDNFWWNLPAYVDRWRIFPRIFISVYIYLLYQSVTWFMALPSPTVEQAGLISVIFSVGGFWFNSYLMTPPKKLENLKNATIDYDKSSDGSYSVKHEQYYNTNTQGNNYE